VVSAWNLSTSFRTPNNTVFALVRSVEVSAKNLGPYIERGNVHVIQFDLSKPASIKAAVEDIKKITDSIDVLINNAALLNEEEGSTLALEEEKLVALLENSFRINTIGPILTTNAFLPLIKKSHLKKAVVISSGLADIDFNLDVSSPYAPQYCISKAGINVAYAKYAVQYKEDGVLFLSLSPGLVNTAEVPPTPEQLVALQGIIRSFQKVYPQFVGPITPTESVSKCLKVIESLSPENSGQFLSHLGSKQWL